MTTRNRQGGKRFDGSIAINCDRMNYGSINLQAFNAYV